MTDLDRLLFELIDAHPEWMVALSPEQIRMVELRRRGASLKEIAAEFDLTSSGIRLRLYGKGAGLRRGGGILGYLRTQRNRERRNNQTA
jgi:transposase-like protein